MKIYYNAKIDTLYIEFRPGLIGTTEARSLNDELIANYGPDGKLIGLEILAASQVLGQPEVETRDNWLLPEVIDPIQQTDLLRSITNRMQQNPIPLGAPRWTREELHARR